MEYIYRAGKDYVRAAINDDVAKRIIEEGEAKKDDTFDNFPVCVNGEMWFPETKLKVVKGKRAPKKEEPEKAPVEVPVEEVPFEGVVDEADD